METLSVPSKIVRAHEDGSSDIYHIRRSIGKGGFSTVFEASLFRTNQTFAVKAISLENLREKDQVKNQLEETKIQCSLNHPNILRAYDYFQDGINFYIILEYCPYHSVYNLFKQHRKFSEIDTADIIKQVLEGVQYLHQNLVIHRDIKPQNLLIGSDGKIKISDFGISTKLTSKTQRCHTNCGTRGYMCPELIKRDQNGYSFESDIWAIGVCTFLFLTGSHPFATFDKQKTEMRILNNDYSFPSKLQLSSSSKDFVKQILQTDPKKRPTLNFLLKHPFITKSQKTPHTYFFNLLLERPENQEKPLNDKPQKKENKPQKKENKPQKNQDKPLNDKPQKNQEKKSNDKPQKKENKPQNNQDKPLNDKPQKSQDKPQNNHDKPLNDRPQNNQDKPPNILSQKNHDKPQIISPRKNHENRISTSHLKDVSGHPRLQKKIDALNINNPNRKHGMVVKVYKIKKVKKRQGDQNDDDEEATGSSNKSKPPIYERIELPPLKKDNKTKPSRLNHQKEDDQLSTNEQEKDDHSENSSKKAKKQRKQQKQQQEQQQQQNQQQQQQVQQDQDDKFSHEIDKYYSIKKTPQDFYKHSLFRPERNDHSPRKGKPTKLPPLKKENPSNSSNLNNQQEQQPSSSFKPENDHQSPRKQSNQNQNQQVQQDQDDKFSQENDKYYSLKKTPQDFNTRSLYKPERNEETVLKPHKPSKPSKLPPLKPEKRENQEEQENHENQDDQENQENQDDQDVPVSLSKLEMYGRPQPTETLKRKRHQTSSDTNFVQNLHNIPSYCIINFFADNEKGEIYYFMKNGQVGMISNDQQRLVLDPFCEYVQIWPHIEDYKPATFSLDEAKEIENVSKLLKYEKIFKDSNIHHLEIPNSKNPESIPMRHIKYCMNNEEGIMFRMDNRVTQMNFPDKSKLIVFWEQKSLIATHSLFRNGLFMTFDSLKKSGNEELKKKYSIAKNMIGLICK